jgi:hypothetical protein
MDSKGNTPGYNILDGYSKMPGAYERRFQHTFKG